MIRGLLTKSLYETWLNTVLFAVALFAFSLLLACVMPQIQEGMGQVMTAMPFVRHIVQAMLGVDLGESVSLQVMQAIVWVHPVILTTLWAYEIIHCTRFPAGEVDRGTTDYLMGLPVTRRAIYWTEVGVCTVGGLILLTAGLSGQILGAWLLTGALPFDWSATLLVLVNLFCLYLAVTGLASLASACCSRRGVAAGIVGALVISSFLLNFIAQFWEPVQSLSFLGLLHYYRPAQLLLNGSVPVMDYVVLLAVAAVTLVAGAEIVVRRRL